MSDAKEVADVTRVYAKFLEQNRLYKDELMKCEKEAHEAAAAGDRDLARSCRRQADHYRCRANELCSAFGWFVTEPLEQRLRDEGVLYPGYVLSYEERDGRWVAVTKTWEEQEEEDLGDWVKRGIAVEIEVT